MAFQGGSVRLWKAILRLRLQHLMQIGLTALSVRYRTSLYLLNRAPRKNPDVPQIPKRPENEFGLARRLQLVVIPAVLKP
jgi:hypothetical protein